MTTDGSYATTAKLASTQHGVVSADDASTAGLTRHEIDRLVRIGAFERPAPGVLRVVGAPETWRQRLMVAVLSAGPGCVASHQAAAALHRFDRFPAGPVEVLVSRPYRARDPRVRIHSTRRLDPVDVTAVDGIPVTTPERTLVDLAARVGANRLEEALDGGVRDHKVDLVLLRARITSLRRRGRAGIPKIELLVDGPSSVRPKSILERRFLRAVSTAGLPEPTCQVPVRRPDGSPASVDFVFPGTNVAVEVDGHGTHATRRQRRHDNERANDIILATDLRILRFTYEQIVYHTDTVIAHCRGMLVQVAS